MDTERATSFEFLKVAYTDMNGLMRGKTVRARDFDSLVQNGTAFYDGAFASDYQDVLLEQFPHTSWEAGYPDAPAQLIPDTVRPLGGVDHTAIGLCEIEGRHKAICPRSLLRAQVEKAERLGFHVLAGIEYEFSLLDHVLEDIASLTTQRLKPLTPGNANSSVLRTSMNPEFFQTLFTESEGMGIPIESLHTECAPGAIEAALRYTHALEMADRAILFKNLVKTLAHQFGWTASFMAKLHPKMSGQGGHLHLSLQTLRGENAFFDPAGIGGLSSVGQHFLAGVLAWAPELMAIFAPTVNSYARLVPNVWAPLDANWGFDHRGTAVRALTDNPHAARLENRLPGADSNPYLVMAATLSAGLFGIEQGLPLMPPVEGNGSVDAQPLPRTLQAATHAFQNSTGLRETLGHAFVDGFTALRNWEVQQSTEAVSDWALQRYLETV